MDFPFPPSVPEKLRKTRPPLAWSGETLCRRYKAPLSPPPPLPPEREYACDQVFFFADFFSAREGVDPYPFQRLFSDVVLSKRWTPPPLLRCFFFLLIFVHRVALESTPFPATFSLAERSFSSACLGDAFLFEKHKERTPFFSPYSLLYAGGHPPPEKALFSSFLGGLEIAIQG